MQIGRISGASHSQRTALRLSVFPLAVLGAALALPGCGSATPPPSLGQVKGKVMLDGGPAPGVVVIFMPDTGRMSTGITDQNGDYVLEFDPGHQGAMLGKHKVRMTKNMEALLMNGDFQAGPPQPIPARYNDETILEADVKAGENTCNFELTSTS